MVEFPLVPNRRGSQSSPQRSRRGPSLIPLRFPQRPLLSINLFRPSSHRDSHLKALSFTFPFVPLDDPDRRRKKIKLFPQTVLEMAQEGKMQARLSAGREYDHGGRTDAYLREILHVQARAPMRFCR